MKSSSERILTTHVGSLPRPAALLDLLLAREEGRAVDEPTFEARSAGPSTTSFASRSRAASTS
jgi:5-methyltetrahydropteroyltriglutamate--homocysteine methyltransferase